MNAIQRACKIVGSQKALADFLQITPAAVYQWVSGIKRIPADRCPSIERATKGAVRCEEMRPDVDWAYIRSSKKRRLTKQD